MYLDFSFFILQPKSCRGQTYDSTSKMQEKKSGVATRKTAEEPKVHTVHCYGHSLNLAVKQLTSSWEVLGETMARAGEIYALT